jgi:hypothetical protein
VKEAAAVGALGSETATHERPNGLSDFRHAKLFLAQGLGHSVRRSIGLIIISALSLPTPSVPLTRPQT